MTWRARNRDRVLQAALDDLPRYGPTWNEQLASCAQREPIEWAKPLNAIVHPATGLTSMVAQARREMGPERWLELNKEWNV